MSINAAKQTSEIFHSYVTVNSCSAIEKRPARNEQVHAWDMAVLSKLLLPGNYPKHHYSQLHYSTDEVSLEKGQQSYTLYLGKIWKSSIGG